MCRTVTALGVLYHNYRIINTPPPSQEGLYCMHDTGCRKEAGVIERGQGVALVGGAPAGIDGMGVSAVHLASTAVLY